VFSVWESGKSPIDLKNPAHYNGWEVDNSTPTLTGVLMSGKIRSGMMVRGHGALKDEPTIATKHYVQETS
jgi:hypothetical protein